MQNAIDPRALRTALRLAALSCLAGLALPRLAAAQPSANATSHPGLYLETESGPIPLPLATTRVRGEVQGFVAHIRVVQTYVNPYDQTIEARYLFPLSETAAVSAMVMRVAGREIIAEIQTREAAEATYEQAKAQGHTAALMTQERPNIFTQKVGNIPPGQAVEVELTFDDLLPYRLGTARFVFPTVVGPRYIPGQPLDRLDHESDARSVDTDAVPDASRITPLALVGAESSAHRIDLELRVAPGLPIRALRSPSHSIAIEERADDDALVRIAADDAVPNKDFILDIDLRGARPAVALLAHRGEKGRGYLTLAIQPPARPKPDEIAGKDLFFVVDNSGSMSGEPMAAAKALVRHALGNMNDDDRFTIMRFSDDVSALSEAPLSNTRHNVELGLDFIDAMAGMGGTDMLSGILRAMEGRPEPGRVRIVFFLTDGYIGNDDAILRAVQRDNHAEARLFSLGVGSSVNRYLLAGMARLGRGEMQVVRTDQDPTPVIETFYRQIRNPVLTSISIDWGALDVVEQTPELIHDLFDGQPIVVHARYHKPARGEVTLHGWLGGRKFTHTMKVALPSRAERPAIRSLWARAKIAEWSDEETVRPGMRHKEITAVALGHSLISKYTAFVAVDRQVVARRPSEPLIPVSQRLPLPEGVSELALGWLSRREIPPGDPIIAVAAPADARRVTAYFPFGLIKPLRYDEVRQSWRGRFLVPAGIADGIYTILVVIEPAAGPAIYRHERYSLDSSAEEFLIDLPERPTFSGDLFELALDAVEPAAEVYVDAPILGWDRLRLESVDLGAAIHWYGALPTAGDLPAGDYRVTVVVRDRAGNRLAREITLHLQGPARRATGAL